MENEQHQVGEQKYAQHFHQIHTPQPKTLPRPGPNQPHKLLTHNNNPLHERVGERHQKNTKIWAKMENEQHQVGEQKYAQHFHQIHTPQPKTLPRPGPNHPHKLLTHINNPLHERVGERHQKNTKIWAKMENEQHQVGEQKYAQHFHQIHTPQPKTLPRPGPNHPHKLLTHINNPLHEPVGERHQKNTKIWAKMENEQHQVGEQKYAQHFHQIHTKQTQTHSRPMSNH